MPLFSVFRSPAPRPPARRLGRRVWGFMLIGLVFFWLLPVGWAYWARLDQVAAFRERVGPVRDAVYRLEDPVRRVFGGYAVPDTLPVLRLTLPDTAAARWHAQLDSISARGVNVAAALAARWVGGNLSINSERAVEGSAARALPAEVAWHGKHFRHWAGRQRSFKVRLGGGAAWWGLQDFSLITPDNRDGPGLLLVAELARTAGIWHPRERVVRVEVNGADWGMYYLEEPIGADFLARRGARGGAILTPRATWADDFPDHRRAPAYGQGVGFNRAAHVHALALEPAFQEVEAPSDSLAAVARGQWQRLRDVVEAAEIDPAHQPDSAIVAAIFDVPAWGAADALRHLLADRHNLAGDNLHVVFDPPTHRFRPIYRFEGGLAAATRTNGLTNAATLSYNGGPLRLWRFVNVNPTLRLAKLRALHRLTATPAVVDAALQAIGPASALLTAAPGAQYPIRQRRWVAQTIGRDLRANRALIHENLTAAAWLYSTAHLANGRLHLELMAETEGALTVGAPVGGVGRPRLLVAGVGPLTPSGLLGLVPARDTLSWPWPIGAALPNALQLSVRNALTGKLLPAARVRIASVASEGISPRPAPVGR